MAARSISDQAISDRATSDRATSGRSGTSDRATSRRADAWAADPLALFGLDAGEAAAGVLSDAPRIRSLLIEAARGGGAVSYSAMLLALGLRFTRPKMRALCVTMGAIDRAGAAAGEPGLAVLVVRESDGLPGQGWWTTHARAQGHAGDWTGPEARRLVTTLQGRAIRHWRERG